jgi:hypothetical protein
MSKYKTCPEWAKTEKDKKELRQLDRDFIKAYMVESHRPLIEALANPVNQSKSIVVTDYTIT